MLRSVTFALAIVLTAGSGCERAEAPAAQVARSTENSAASSAANPPSPSPPTPPTASAAVAPPAPLPAGPLTLVTDRSQVCMVNDQFMGRPQIPVPVNGTTYYGCCPMCKGRLANDPSSRQAVDPVTNRPVDKAVAVIGRAESGAVVYFESERTLEAHASRQARTE